MRAVWQSTAGVVRHVVYDLVATLKSTPIVRLAKITAVLVLAAIPGSVRADNAPQLQVQVVCELTGAAVTVPFAFRKARCRFGCREFHFIVIAIEAGYIQHLRGSRQHAEDSHLHLPAFLQLSDLLALLEAAELERQLQEFGDLFTQIDLGEDRSREGLRPPTPSARRQRGLRS